MNNIYSLSAISLIISFIVTLMVIPWLIKKMNEAGITGIDMNKEDKPSIPDNEWGVMSI